MVFSGMIFEPIIKPDVAELLEGQIIFIAWGSLITVAATVFLLGRYIDKRPISEFGISMPKKPLSSAFLGIGIGAIAPVLTFCTLLLIRGYKITGVNYETSFFSFVNFFLIVLPAALKEEIVFRGYTMANLKERLGVVPLAIISATIFTLFHITSILTKMIMVAFVSYLLGGLLLAMAFIYDSNLWLPMWIHISNNYVYNLLFT